MPVRFGPVTQADSRLEDFIVKVSISWRFLSFA